MHAGEQSELRSLTVKLCHDRIRAVLSACPLHHVGSDLVVLRSIHDPHQAIQPEILTLIEVYSHLTDSL